MRGYAVHARRDDAPGLLLNCQSELLSDLNTRLVAPLLPFPQARMDARRLNPVFDIGGQRYVMATQFAAAVPLTELGPLVARLTDDAHQVTAAFDMLLSGV